MNFKKKGFTPKLAIKDTPDAELGETSLRMKNELKTENMPDLAALGKAAKEAIAKVPPMPTEAELKTQAVDGPMYPGPAMTFEPLPYREPRWLTSPEVAKHLHVSIRRLAKLRAAKSGPRYYQLVDGLVLYNVHDVDAWVMSHGTDEMEISY